MDSLVEEMAAYLEERGYKVYIDLEEASRYASRLLEMLAGYDVNLTYIGERKFPVVIIRLEKYIVYVVVLGSRVYLNLRDAFHLISDISGMLEVAAKAFSPVLLVHDFKGVMSSLTYLYFGKVIERGIFRLLFINGGFKEILEIVWSLENLGKYVPQEEDMEKVDLPLI